MATTNSIKNPVGVKFTVPDATQQFDLGSRAEGDYAGQFFYGKADAALAAGDVIVFDKDFNATGLATANSPRGAKIGVARVAFASGQFGWFQVGGQAPIRTSAAVAAGVRLNTTATAGAVDDDGTASTKEIVGMTLSTLASGATTTAEAVMTEPFVGATL